jgi:cytochrome c553
MRKFVKVLVGVVVVLLFVAARAVAFAQFGSERKLHRIVQVNVAAVAIPTDAASLERGQYLYKSRGCAECHGADGAGKVVFDNGGFRVKSPHITAGDGSVTATYKPEDWVRAIRHGVKPSGEPLLIMPSEDYARLTDADVGAIIGYVGSLPPVAGTAAELKVPLMVRFLYAAGMIKDAAEKIDHELPPAQPFASDDQIAHGAYVAAACQGCHNESLSGGPVSGGPPNWPSAANLTPGSESVLPRYPNAEALAAMFRSGKRPDGTAVNDAMPFPMLKEISDDDVNALYAFLNTLPAKDHGKT